MLRPASLAQQNALRLIVVFVAFEIIAALAVVWFLMMPLAWRSADDFAGLLTLSAETWGELPPMTRPAFERHLAEVHGIELQVAPPPDAREREGRDLYVRRVEETLRAEFGDAIRIAGAERAGEPWHWVTIPVGERIFWLGFPHSRLGTQPLMTVLLTFGAGLILAVLAAWWLAQRIVAPLERLDEAAAVLGRGERPGLLPETGPRELAALARRVNGLVREVHDLLDGRTTLLAGLSHDLRTPLARMRLAVELLQRRPDPALVQRLERDIEEMNRLVGEMLALARGLGRETNVDIDVPPLLEELAQAGARGGAARRGVGRAAACLRRADGAAPVARQPAVQRAAIRRQQCRRTAGAVARNRASASAYWTAAPASRPTSSKPCSVRSTGSMRRARREPVDQDLASRSCASLPRPMAGRSRSRIGSAADWPRG